MPPVSQSTAEGAVRLPAPDYSQRRSFSDYALNKEQYPETYQFLCDLRRQNICIFTTPRSDGRFEVRLVDISRPSRGQSYTFLDAPMFVVNRSDLEKWNGNDKTLLNQIENQVRSIRPDLVKEHPGPEKERERPPERVQAPPPRRVPALSDHVLDQRQYPQTYELLCAIREHGLCLHGTNTPDGGVEIRFVDMNKEESSHRRYTFLPIESITTSYELLRTGNMYDEALRRRIIERLQVSRPDLVAGLDRPSAASALPPTMTPIHAVVHLSSSLSLGQMWNGTELRSADMLHEMLVRASERSAVPVSTDDLRVVRHGVLHALQKVEREHPGYLASLGAQSEQHLADFALGVAQELLAERRRKESVVVADRNTRVVAICNIEAGFSDTDLTRLFDRFGVENKTILKANAHDAQKDQFLRSVTECASDTTQRSVVWCNTHGQPNFLQLRTGFGKSETIMASEMARALLRQQGNEVSLDHMTVVLDSCFSWNYGNRIIRELISEAEKEGKTLRSLPTIVTAAQRDMIAWTANDGVQSQMTQALRETLPPRQTVLTLGDMMRADDRASQQASAMAKRGAIDRKMKSFLPGQDNAIFSSDTTSLDELMSAVQARLAERRIHIEIPAGSARGSRRIPVEISRAPGRLDRRDTAAA